MSPEIEVLDQLLGGDLPLSVVVELFADEAHARQAIAAMVQSGEVEVLEDGAPLPLWRLRELTSQEHSLRTEARYQLSITEAGAKRVSRVSLVVVLPTQQRKVGTCFHAMSLLVSCSLPSNLRCCWRWSYGTRRGTRFARVHAILLNPPQQNFSRFAGYRASSHDPLQMWMR
jgi:hypothetical protein